MMKQAYTNTDRELWRKPTDDSLDPDGYYQPRLFVTKTNGIGISVGGHVIILPIERWHALAQAATEASPAPKPRTPVRPSERRDRILAFVIDYKFNHDGNSPTIREICDGLGDSSLSTSVVNFHLDGLARAGKILRPARSYQRRAIEVVGGQWLYEPDLMPEYRGVELPTSGAIAHVAPDITPETLAALDEMMQIAAEQFAQAPNGPITQSLTDPIAK